MTMTAGMDQPREDAPAQEAPAKQEARIYQIYYSDRTRAMLDPGFLPLDNSDNARPDWREYWPIRRSLLNGMPDGDVFIGFLSPNFRRKTGLDAAQVFETIDRRGAGADVIGFCSYFDQAAYFTNVFEHGESVHGPGFVDAAQAFLDAISVESRVAELLMGSGTTIYCNYFVANARFWQTWLDWNEKLFAIAEAGDTPLGRRLNMPVPYLRTTLPMKVFIMERMVSLILATQTAWRVQAFDPYRMSGINPALTRFPLDLIQLDALKVAYRHLAFPEYRQAFFETRRAMNEKLARVREELKPRQ